MNTKGIEAVSHPEYRCRRCGKVFTRFLVELSSINDAVRKANYSHLCFTSDDVKRDRKSGLSEGLYSIPLFYIHLCADKARGVADLIGASPPLEAVRQRNKWINPQTKEELVEQNEI